MPLTYSLGNEHRFAGRPGRTARWRRTQRDESYQALLHQFYAYREAIRLLGRAADRPATAEAVSAAYLAWNQAASGVWLRGTEPVVTATLLLDAELVRLADRARADGIAAAEWPEAREPAQRCFDDLVDAVRRDLTLPPLNALRAGAAERSIAAS